tara:strand:- start:466 stop:654 length:189 start_codon:yes stop_codon:yes gene_type:complete
MILKYYEKRATEAGVKISPLGQMKVLGIRHTDYDPFPQGGTYLFTVNCVPNDLPDYIELLSR